jgi:hypothetical protein
MIEKDIKDEKGIKDINSKPRNPEPGTRNPGFDVHLLNSCASAEQLLNRCACTG